MRRRLTFVFLLVMGTAALPAAEALSFSGYAGLLADITGDVEKTTPAPSLTMQGFLAAQLEFAERFIFRGEFNLRMSNLFEPNNNPLKPYKENTMFSIGEASLTYRLSSASLTHFISAFFGKFEPVGSDVFLQRHLGLMPISSHLTHNWGGLVSAGIFNLPGLGLSYTAHLKKPMVLGIYLFAYDSGNMTFSINSLNTELRFAGTFPELTFDASANFSFEFTSGAKLYDSGAHPEYAGVKDDLLILRYMLFKTGANVLLGSRYSRSILIQFGLNNVQLGGSDRDTYKGIADGENLYLLVEPRMNFDSFQISVAAFNLPRENLRDLLYLKGFYVGDDHADERGIIGLNGSIMSDTLRVGGLPLTVGANLSLYFENTTLISMFTGGDFTNLRLYMTPFAKMTVFGGTLEAAASFNPLWFATSAVDGNGNWVRAFDAFVGFKTQI